MAVHETIIGRSDRRTMIFILRVIGQNRILILFAVLLAMCPAANATAAIVFWSTTTIRIAADSKQTHEAHASANIACKIFRVGGTVFVTAGIILERRTNYDAISALTAILNHADNFRDSVDTAIRTMTVQLRETLIFQRDHDPTAYARTFQNPGVVFSLAIAGIENGVARVVVADFQYLPDQRTISPRITRCPEHCGTAQNFFLGFASVSPTYLKEHPSTSEHLRKALEIESSANPDDVGTPISVIELTPGETRWVCQGVC